MANKTYTHEEMIEEIVGSIEEIGGEVIISSDTIDDFSTGFKLVINQDLLQQAKLIVGDIQKKYKRKRKQILNDNPFIGTQELLDNF